MFFSFLLSLIISLAAWRARALSRGGALAACGVGTLIFGCGGLNWAIILLAFFISSSLLSRLLRRRQGKAGVAAKGSRRDAGQVLANGGAAAALAALHGILAAGGSAAGAGVLWAAFCASLAAVNADTWATEIGALSRVPPRLLTSRQPVEPGTSGGVTPLGSLAAAGGALFIALPGFWLAPAGAPGALPLFLAIAVCGFLGSLVDSLLGATLQALFYCPACGKPTEQHPQHACGSPTSLQRGLAWLDNDLVNLACALSAAGLAVMGFLLEIF